MLLVPALGLAPTLTLTMRCAAGSVPEPVLELGLKPHSSGGGSGVAAQAKTPRAGSRAGRFDGRGAAPVARPARFPEIARVQAEALRALHPGLCAGEAQLDARGRYGGGVCPSRAAVRTGIKGAARDRVSSRQPWRSGGAVVCGYRVRRRGEAARSRGGGPGPWMAAGNLTFPLENSCNFYLCRSLPAGAGTPVRRCWSLE
ncbi:PREDICTED: uncharacterized protein LOC102003680 [Chinchilla lanigera]|uniref:uncharacterized protein LOC102003680 n=1 Tax=Chinchilla lanigera TaxID=34839 RepID=UPI0006991F75|nr:PREDICTED: uncharacterized protein LOC102003680 [Chinchilla lanigera]